MWVEPSQEAQAANLGSLARRIATYKIGAFLLSACGLGLAPLVAATAEVPLMAIPGLPPAPSSQVLRPLIFLVVKEVC